MRSIEYKFSIHRPRPRPVVGDHKRFSQRDLIISLNDYHHQSIRTTTEWPLLRAISKQIIPLWGNVDRLFQSNRRIYHLGKSNGQVSERSIRTESRHMRNTGRHEETLDPSGGGISLPEQEVLL